MVLVFAWLLVQVSSSSPASDYSHRHPGSDFGVVGQLVEPVLARALRHNLHSPTRSLLSVLALAQQHP